MKTTSNNSTSVPSFQGEPILDGKPRPAFRVAVHDIMESIRQQFPDRRLAFRELGQNSADAGATKIRVLMRHEDGCMIADFVDDGCGMTRGIIESNYLTLFDSSKEEREGCIGYYSLGRISAFVYPLESLELFTLAERSPGYHLEIRADYSGRLFEVEAGEVAGLLDSEHGTLVRLRYPVEDPAAFANEVNAINESLRQEIRWLHARVTTTTCTIEGDKLKFGTETINSPLAVPGRLSHTVDVRLASQLGSATVALGIEGEETGTPKGGFEVLTTGLSPATLSIGRIPVLRANELPWTGGEPFMIRNLRVVVDSFQFKTNIGRNVVYLNQEFPRELLPKIFKNLILERYVPALAKAFAGSAGARVHNTALRTLLLDVFAQADPNNYCVPEELLDAPLLPALHRRIDYSVREVDATGDKTIFLTYMKKDYEEALNEDEGRDRAICISLCDLTYPIRTWLERRYSGRVMFKETDFLPVGENAPEARLIADRIHDTLAMKGSLKMLETTMFSSADVKLATTVSCGRFERFDGGYETRLSAHVFESPRRVVLNLDNAHIQRLQTLLEGGKRSLASHFLFREVLFAKGQKLPVAHREQLLTRDLNRRFGGTGETHPTIEELFECLCGNIESL